ncbi:hypothetical protein [Rhodoferax fermentans]|uniref:Uncharacterized protein n=1 Tax=Rhodoferax fermentans TaxID=28066 RepID=A0A1T1APD1_RHOFE|nr:hypothetical protein [Rhodoferax fermentans]MBK1683401.1 hypothetical protein [Rhodoferax fermentans]OOV05853.1 hypothetical protein RF819_03215 [Rhodoferax fermentans]
MIVGQHRGNFPKGIAGEPAQAKRLRYEDWLIATRERLLTGAEFAAQLGGATEDRKHLDPEFDAVMYQPGRTAAVTRPSKTLAIRARCWQCVSGDDDDGGTTRIAVCSSTGCALHSVRPYQPEGARVKRLPRADADVSGAGLHRLDHGAKAVANPGNIGLAVRGYCHQCCGGRSDVGTMREAQGCAVANCGLWRVRPGANSGGDLPLGAQDDLRGESVASEGV